MRIVNGVQRDEQRQDCRSANQESVSARWLEALAGIRADAKKNSDRKQPVHRFRRGSDRYETQRTESRDDLLPIEAPIWGVCDEQYDAAERKDRSNPVRKSFLKRRSQPRLTDFSDKPDEDKARDQRIPPADPAEIHRV